MITKNISRALLVLVMIGLVCAEANAKFDLKTQYNKTIQWVKNNKIATASIALLIGSGILNGFQYRQYRSNSQLRAENAKLESELVAYDNVMLYLDPNLVGQAINMVEGNDNGIEKEIENKPVLEIKIDKVEDDAIDKEDTSSGKEELIKKDSTRDVFAKLGKQFLKTAKNIGKRKNKKDKEEGMNQ